MKIRRTAALIAVSMAYAMPAAAQDAAPDEQSPYKTAGLRLEIATGYDNLEVNYYEDDTKYYDGSSGVRYGAEAGYDVAVSRNLLLGGYVGATGTSTDRCDAVLAGTLCQKPGLELVGGVRLGIMAGERTQFYFRGGYTSMKLDLSYTEGRFTDATSETYSGGHFGFGAEYAFPGGAYAKADLGMTSFSTSDRLYEDLNLERRQAIVGVGFRF